MGEGPQPESQPFHLTDTDLQVLSMKDDEYTLLTWPRIKEILVIGDLELLTRLPSQLRLYRVWSAGTKVEYGTITNFLLKKRLYWEAIPSDKADEPPRFVCEDPVPFKARSDYRILLNDWPYGLAPDIRHVCVWLKTPLPVDTEKGALTEEGRVMVNDFVGEHITKALGVEGQDKVAWFKNYTVLQSIRAVDHVHVLLRDVDEKRLDAILEKPWLE
jgi:hypothetical protein